MEWNIQDIIKWIPDYNVINCSEILSKVECGLSDRGEQVGHYHQRADGKVNRGARRVARRRFLHGGDHFARSATEPSIRTQPRDRICQFTRGDFERKRKHGLHQHYAH